jgi:hypothetical protein
MDSRGDWTQPQDLLKTVAKQEKRPVLSKAFDAANGGSTGEHTDLLSCLLAPTYSKPVVSVTHGEHPLG